MSCSGCTASSPSTAAVLTAMGASVIEAGPGGLALGISCCEPVFAAGLDSMYLSCKQMWLCRGKRAIASVYPSTRGFPSCRLLIRHLPAWLIPASNGSSTTSNSNTITTATIITADTSSHGSHSHRAIGSHMRLSKVHTPVRAQCTEGTTPTILVISTISRATFKMVCPAPTSVRAERGGLIGNSLDAFQDRTLLMANLDHVCPFHLYLQIHS